MAADPQGAGSPVLGLVAQLVAVAIRSRASTKTSKTYNNSITKSLVIAYES